MNTICLSKLKITGTQPVINLFAQDIATFMGLIPINHENRASQFIEYPRRTCPAKRKNKRKHSPETD